MMKKMIKDLLACVVFCALTLMMIQRVNDILVPKVYNHYYVMDHAIEAIDEHIAVQVYGACHSYTSFQAAYYEEKYGHTAYDLGNPGELIPVTYLRMMEHFKADAPEVALVEIWGINAYETYHSYEENFVTYLPSNIERLPLSPEKIKVILTYDSLDLLNENLAIAKYKDRIMDMDLFQADFQYTLEGIESRAYEYTRVKMHWRIENNGFCEMPYYCFKLGYDPYLSIPDYHQKQAVVGDDEILEPEPDMREYLDKIIQLCEAYDVELIFYRAPYISTENELRKANWVDQYCESKGILYLDLEKEINFYPGSDFLDYYHLNESGAIRATNFLASYIQELMDNS